MNRPRLSRKTRPSRSSQTGPGTPGRSPRLRWTRRIALLALLTGLGLFMTTVVFADPPTGVDFNFSPGTPQVGQSVSFNGSFTDADETPTVSWDFGDGSNGSGSSPSHSYSSAGDKTVTLTVDNGTDPAVTVSHTVHVNAAPTAAFSFSPAHPTPGQSVSFDASGSSDSDGTISSYSWSFGDGGTSTDANPSHTYSSSGPETVTLTVTDNTGATNSVTHSVPVNNPPSASFSFTPDVPNVNDTVSFVASASDSDGTISSYAWDFGDGSTGSGQKPTHKYTSAGDKTVKLTVTDNNGATAQVTDVVPVHAAPVATITSCPSPAQLNQPDTFTGSGSASGGATIQSLNWNFGDGGTGSGSPVSHTFSSASADRTVTLTATDSSNATSAPVSCHVRVNPPPNPVIDFHQVSLAVGGCAGLQTGQNNQFPLVGQCLTLGAGATTDTSDGTHDDSGTGDNALTFAWTLDGNPLPGATAGTQTPIFVAGDLGTHTVSLQVTDPDGGKATTTYSFRVNQPPKAEFAISPTTTPLTTESVTFSSRADDGDLARNLSPLPAESLTYSWDFGDGTKSTAVNPPPHNYPKAGTYHVTLTVTDQGGATSSVTHDITVQKTRPKADFTYSPSAPVPGQQITFSAQASPFTAGNPITEDWDFNYDGTTFHPDSSAVGDQTALHSFSSPGPHVVALRVSETNGGFSIVSKTVTVNATPNAGFTFTPAAPFTGNTVTFSSTSSDPDGPLASQQWDLDNDGQFNDASGAVVTKKFTKAGTYTVKLRVTDSQGATAIASQTVKVVNAPLTVLGNVSTQFVGFGKGRNTVVRRLYVTAPSGAIVLVRCSGRGCPRHIKSLRSRGRKLRIRAVERTFRPGATITVIVTKKGFISKVTIYKMRSRREPQQLHRCQMPSAKKIIKCPRT